MKLSDFIELCKMIELLVNEGDSIKDFSINDEAGALDIMLKSGEFFSFSPNK
jgi:hypothetical protein